MSKIATQEIINENLRRANEGIQLDEELIPLICEKYGVSAIQVMAWIEEDDAANGRPTFAGAVTNEGYMLSDQESEAAIEAMKKMVKLLDERTADNPCTDADIEIMRKANGLGELHE